MKIFFGAVINPAHRLVYRACESLDGTWGFRLDPADKGRDSRWERAGRFDSRVKVPGAWQAQGFGGKMPHPISQMGHPALQVERTAYSGTAWYRRKFDVPAEWKGKRIWLKFGGVHPRAEFWLNGKYLGQDPGGLLSFKFDITGITRYCGGNELTIRVFEGNRVHWDVAFNGGIYCWATVWSGIYRGVELEATEDVWIESVGILPSYRKKHAVLSVTLGNVSGTTARNAELLVSAGRTGVGFGHTLRLRTNVPAGMSRKTVTLKIPDAAAWSPEEPNLYVLNTSISHGGRLLDTVSERFGMRDFEVRGRKLLINGRPVYLRGVGCDTVFPRTLAPDLDPAWIRKQISVAKAYGFNGIVSYGVPYREFLDAADETGMLLQVFPGDLSATGLTRREHLERLILQNVNHPSIMVYGTSAERYDNEPEFVRNVDRMYEFYKRTDPTRLVIGRDGGHIRNVGFGKTDFLELAACYRTCHSDRMLKEKTTLPVVMHEVGWWSSYPNPVLKSKYDGCAMRPFFIEYAEKIARRKGMEHLLPVFVKNSERLQALERKTGLELIRKRACVSGYHLWTGNDTVSAVEGVWDDFGDPKNVAPEEFLKTNGETVLLMDQDFRGRYSWVVPPDEEPETNPHDICRDFQGRTLWEGETLKVKFLLSHYGAEPVRSGVLDWVLKETGSGKVLSRGTLPGIRAGRYTVSALGGAEIRFSAIGKAARLSLEAALRFGDRRVENSWNFWVFPRNLLKGTEKGVYIYGGPRKKDYGMDLDDSAGNEISLVGPFPRVDTDARLVIRGIAPDARVIISFNTLSNGLIDYLEDGGTVFLLTEKLFPEYYHRFRSIPWNGYPFGNSGTVVRDHPALKRFPHQGWCDLQFYDMARTITARREDEGGVVNLDVWPARIDPIIRSIDSYMGCRNRGLLFEVKVGKGNLLVSRLNFVRTPASHFLFSELVRYLLSGQCRPESRVDGRFLRNFVTWG